MQTANKTRASAAPSGRDIAMVGGPYTGTGLAVGLGTVLCNVLILLCLLYGLSDVFLQAVVPVPAPASQGGNILDPASITRDVNTQIIASLHNLVAIPRDAAGYAITGGTTPHPDPLVALGIAMTAVTFRQGLRSATARRLRNAMAATADTPPELPPNIPAASDTREHRIATVHAVIAQLDAEWFSYETDLEAYYLTRPSLRDPEVTQTAAYLAAVYDLREHADGLTDDSSAQDLDDAEHAAEAALLAWGAANDHAQAVGISDRSPAERAALKRLYALTGQLADPATPEPMCQALSEAITREMDRLAASTVRVSWEHLSRVPALENRIPAAIAQRAHGQRQEISKAFESQQDQPTSRDLRAGEQ
ncbi:hypothetical protein OS121_29570 [Mycolicibacterium mucogenicum]|uniref:hypothetical protein n=1 Tax=Mycolicibacterium mucogenicum TaxID=56689 RepID=UPI00226A613F|nr:hypothetical protein [Mycolicibacterium mucogenicum]MCX8559198.1 hypothetical protein [Mycolicibacterium mucogenicum]